MLKLAKSFIIVTLWQCHLGKELSHDTLLHKDLFTNYSRNVRPVMNSSQAINVNVSLYLIKLGAINEKEQMASSSVWFELRWTDEMLSWNPHEYGNISVTFLDQKMIWIPDVAIRNVVGNKKGIKSSDNADNYLIPVLFSNGTVTFWTDKEITTHCAIDVTNFPFDTQHCRIEIGTWISGDNWIAISSFDDDTMLTHYEKNDEWEVIALFAEKRVLFEVTGNYSRIIYEIVMKRHPMFHVLNVVLPLILMSLVNMLSFVLPPESGEKVGLSMTVFLTLAVFMTIINESLPRSSVNIPAFGVYLLIQNILSSLTVVMQVLVVSLQYKESRGETFCGYLSRIVDGKNFSYMLNRIFGGCVLVLNLLVTTWYVMVVLL